MKMLLSRSLSLSIRIINDHISLMHSFSLERSGLVTKTLLSHYRYFNYSRKMLENVKITKTVEIIKQRSPTLPGFHTKTNLFPIIVYFKRRNSLGAEMMNVVFSRLDICDIYV